MVGTVRLFVGLCSYNSIRTTAIVKWVAVLAPPIAHQVGKIVDRTLSTINR